ncbi:MAG: oligosaccharide flippase family protein [Planctomycetales bacterium]|nr:oligosaccharide flippase family protein [Planctomycetales bacterium]
MIGLLRAFGSRAQRAWGSLDHGTRLRDRVLRGVFWTIVGNAAWRACSAVSTIFVARILGVAAFGELGMIQSTTQMFSVFAAMRMGTTTTKYVAEYRRTDPHRAERLLRFTLKLGMATCFIFSLACFISSPWIAQYQLQRPELTLPLAIGSLLVLFLIYGNIQQHALVGFEAFQEIARVNAWRGALTPLLCIPLAYACGLPGALVGLIGVAIGTMVISRVYLNRQRRLAGFPTTAIPADRGELWDVFAGFALPGLLMGALVAAVLWYGRTILLLADDGATKLGIFSAADQWRTSVIFFPSALSRVFLPILSESYGAREKDAFVRTSSINLLAGCLSTWPVALLVILLSYPLILLFGEQHLDAAAVLPVLMVSVFFHCMNQSLRQIYDGAGRRWLALVLYILWAAVYVGGAYYFIPRHGALGFAYTHVMADGLLFGLQIAVVEMWVAPGAVRRCGWWLATAVVTLLATVVAHQRWMEG